MPEIQKIRPGYAEGYNGITKGRFVQSDRELAILAQNRIPTEQEQCEINANKAQYRSVDGE
jgi:RNA-binding protein YlmH